LKVDVEFLEMVYKLCGKQFTVVLRPNGFIQATFLYPRSDRVSKDRLKKLKSLEEKGA